MEILTRLAGWVRTPLAGGATLRGPDGLDARIDVEERVAPVPTLRSLLEARLGPSARPGPATRFTTLEGEPAALVSVALPDGVERTLAIVGADHTCAIIDGHTAGSAAGGEAAGAAGAAGSEAAGEAAGEVRALVRLLAEHLYLGLGELRRRRYFYRPPSGWRGVPRPHGARWLHPAFPRVPHAIVIHDARPRARHAADVVDRALFTDGTRGLLTEPPEPLRPIASRSGLRGAAVRIAGRQAEGMPHVATVRATLLDDRFEYVVELTGPHDTVGESSGALAAVVDSIEPVPPPRLPDVSGAIVWWGD